jgi:regulation of enolase protein 1 (concanavalin A-like superfamily)
VVSNPLSDWSIQPYPVVGPLCIRLSAPPGPGAKVHIEYLANFVAGPRWIPIREITGWIFHENEDIDVGIMACSPLKSSFRAEFWDIKAQDYQEIAAQKTS